MNVLPFQRSHRVGMAFMTGLLFLSGIAHAKPHDTNERFYLPAPQQADEEVNGTVKDAAGMPLSGITVTIRGTKNAKVTDADGRFTIKVKKGDVLVFSGVSFTTTERRVADGASYEVVLAEAAATLGDVVVVGYGKSSRKTLTTAVTTVKPEDINKGAISDVGQMLQGKVPGLNITRSGDPNQASAVILRGSSTLNQSQSPFYVIDGVPGADISMIAPDDIASIDVLKDAAATAIYGNRAANGVIMVTTKKGRKGQAVIGYSGYVAMEKVANQLDVMNAAELRSYVTSNGLSFSPNDDKGANTNWQSVVQRDQAISHNHNVSMSGGGDHGTYNASINYYNQEGIVNASNLERIIARLSIEQYALNDKLKLGLNLSNSKNIADYTPYRNTVLSQMITYLPVSPVKNADGSYFENFNNTSYYNPASMIDHGEERSKYNNLIANMTAQVKLPWGLTYDLNVAYQNMTTLYGAFYDSYYTKYYNNVRSTPDPPNNPAYIVLTGTNGYALRNTYQSTNKILETYFTWNRKFGDHSINAVLGYSYQGNELNDGFQTSTTNFSVDNLGYYNLALSNPYAVSSFRVNYGSSGSYQKTKLISDFFRFNYGYKEKYLVQGSIRRDGGSMFGANYRWGYFPSVGAAWRIIQESFMDDQHIFSDLKLRASYGQTGNSSGFNPYTSQFSFNSYGTYYNNGSQVSAIGPSRAANPDLRWEKTATTNIGLDFALLKGRISGTLEVYDKKTTDMIYTYSVDNIIVPIGSITANVGTMSNKGIEFTLNGTVINKKDFTWTSTFNIAHNTNKIVTLSNSQFASDSIRLAQPDGGGQTGSTLQILKAGRPIGQFFTLQYAGKNASGVSQYVARDGSLTTSPSIGVDYHYVGNAQPKAMLGWANTFRYKSFDANIFFRSVLGNKIFNVTRADLFRPTTAATSNILKEVAGESPSDVNSYKYSTRFIENGSFVRLDNATIGYTFRKISNIRNLRVYVSGNNLFIITGYKGIDPEINQGGLAPGVDAFNFYPKTRTFMIGANVTF